MQDQIFANHPKHLSHVAADLRKLVLMKLFIYWSRFVIHNHVCCEGLAAAIKIQ